MKKAESTTWLSPVIETSKYPPLRTNLEVDVLIIGAGITGISTAYLLSQHGKSVAVIEKGTVENCVTGYTTAFITYVIDTSLHELVKIYGEKKAKLIWQSGEKAIDEIERIVKKENIECEFMRCNEYLVATKEDDIKQLQEETKTANKLGYPLEWKDKNDIGFLNKGYIHIPQQAKFHPIKYLQALKKICTQNDIQIYENTEAVKIKPGNPATVSTKENRITAQQVIIATYNPFNHPIELFARKGMYTSYVLEATIPKKSLPEGLYLDQENPYTYWRVDKQKEADRLIIGGKDHRQEIPINKEKNYQALKTQIKKLLPHTEYTITRQWDGPILEPTDGIPSIGRFSHHDNLYVAMAFSGNGMTYSTITGILLKDMILGKVNAWQSVYDPKRIPKLAALLEKGTDYIEEFFDGAAKNIFSS